jgi:chemotaxis protein MotB
MSASLSPYGLKIELSSNSLFNSGSADVKGSMQSSLTDLSGIIQGLGEEDYIVEIEGHTDNVPIKTAKFPSNWELSSLRAVNVAKLFESMGVEKNQLSAIAYADTRPKLPNLDSNGTAIPENQATNRRVVVHVKSLTQLNEADSY